MPEVRVFWGVLLLGCGISGWACSTPSAESDAKLLERGTFFISIQERLEDRESGELVPTEVNVSETLIARRLVQHGFRRSNDPAGARYRIEGTLDCRFHQIVDFEFQGQKTLLEHQYKAEFICLVTDAASSGAGVEGAGGEGAAVTGEPRTERIDIPKMINGRTDESSARIDVRRRVATVVATRLVNGKLLGNSAVKKLVESLGDVYGTRTFNEVVTDLSQVGLPAVPFLLAVLADDRPVRLAGQYPGLEEWNKDSFKYYHVADLALSEILERSSALKLDSSAAYRHAVQQGWTWAWEDIQKIPPEFRENPAQRETSVKAGELLDEGQPSPPPEVIDMGDKTGQDPTGAPVGDGGTPGDGIPPPDGVQDRHPDDPPPPRETPPPSDSGN